MNDAETLDLTLNYTVGHLLNRTDGLVRLAATLGANDDALHVFALPKGCVYQIVRLIEPE